MTTALTISAVGMMLVFIGLLLLWLMMAAIVRLTRDKEKPAAVPPEPNAADQPAILSIEHRKAAAAAAAAILALTSRTSAGDPGKSRAGISPWQAAHRGLQLHNQPPSPHRKD
jgi:Na+-transporting methylmalonyl-CoA/oxaloacetate decarboxylase gamma subunit